MIVTDDDRLAEMCRSMRNQGRPIGWVAPTSLRVRRRRHRHRLVAQARAPGLQLPPVRDINAALGVAQMNASTTSSEASAGRSSSTSTASPATPPHLPTIDDPPSMSGSSSSSASRPSYTAEERDRIIRGLRIHDIGASDYFPCIHLQPFYREQFGFQPGMFPIAESRQRPDHRPAVLQRPIKRESLARS
jgi:perosamine synthetase